MTHALRAGGWPTLGAWPYEPEGLIQTLEAGGWPTGAERSVVKMPDASLVMPAPPALAVAVIWMDRPVRDVIDSGLRFMRYVAGLRLPASSECQYERAKSESIDRLGGFGPLLRVPFYGLCDASADELSRVSAWLGCDLDVERAAEVIERRQPGLRPMMLELDRFALERAGVANG